MRLLLLILLFISRVLQAQDNKKSVFTLKPTLGLNVCQAHGDNFNGFHKIGALGGLTVNSRLNNKTSIDIGFYFSQKGARHNPNPQKNDLAAYRLNLNYI